MTHMEDLPQRLRVVTIRLEVLRQRHCIWCGLAEIRAQLINPQRLRPQPRQ